MTITLHSDCEKRLIEELSNGLASFEVEHGNYINWRSALLPCCKAENILPQLGKNQNGAREALEKYIGENPIYHFVTDELSRLLDEKFEYSLDATPQKLPSLQGFEDTSSLARDLVGALKTLPWNYDLTFELPEKVSSQFAQAFNEFVVTKHLRIVIPDEQFETLFSIDTGDQKQNRARNLSSIALLFMDEPPKWKMGKAYLQIRTQGYVGKYGGTTPDLAAKQLVKAFFGLGLALNIFEHKITYSPFPNKLYYFVHKKDGNLHKIMSRISLDTDIANTLCDVSLSSWFEKIPEKDRALAIKGFIRRMGRVLQQDELADKVRLASQWFFDSHRNNDLALKFVQTTVVLEVLLGNDEPSEELSQTELLSNRCAYLIGSTSKEREEILRDFKKIYKVRSKIVHTGKGVFTSEEYGLFNKLLYFCSRVIEKEVEALLPEKAEHR